MQATLQGLSAQLSQATEIIKWLEQSAKTYTKEIGSLVTWTTPLGLRCVQPYVKIVRLCEAPESLNLGLQLTPVHLKMMLHAWKGPAARNWPGIMAGMQRFEGIRLGPRRLLL